MEYSIGIYRDGSLIDSYITDEMSEAQIDEHIGEVSAAYPDCEVHCIEYED